MAGSMKPTEFAALKGASRYISGGAALVRVSPVAHRGCFLVKRPDICPANAYLVLAALVGFPRDDRGCAS